MPGALVCARHVSNPLDVSTTEDYELDFLVAYVPQCPPLYYFLIKRQQDDFVDYDNLTDW